MASPPEQRYGFGPFVLDPGRYLLLREGVAVPLKPKVFDLLLLLVTSGGRLLTKEELMERLWEDRFAAAVRELGPERGPGPGSGKGAEDPEARLLFLECRHHWHKWTPEGWRRSIERGRRVIERDPGHAGAHAWTAASYCTLGIFGAIPPREAFGRATELVDRALVLDEALPEAHEVRGAVALFYEWDWEAAERSVLRAIELDPKAAGPRDLLALQRIVTGRPQEALEEIRRAVEVEPLSLLTNTDAGNVAYYARRFDGARRQLEHTLELDPWFAHARMGLGRVHLQTGRGEEGVAEIEAALEHSGRERDSSADLGYALAVAGDRGGAEGILDALIECSGSEFVDPYSPALVCVGLGERDRAFEWLDRAFETRSRELIYLRADPVFDPLHGDPRFEELARRIGLPP